MPGPEARAPEPAEGAGPIRWPDLVGFGLVVLATAATPLTVMLGVMTTRSDLLAIITFVVHLVIAWLGVALFWPSPLRWPTGAPERMGRALGRY